MLRRCVLALFLASLPTGVFADQQVTATIAGGKSDAVNVPVSIPLAVAKDLSGVKAVEVTIDGVSLPGQLTEPSLLSAASKSGDTVARELVVIVPSLKAGATANLKAIISASFKSQGGFAWREASPIATDLVFGGAGGKDVGVIRYMHPKYDDSNPDARNKTYKTFHHVYDPTGSRFITNGGHTNENAANSKLLFPHHRGIMMGFNRVSYGPDFKKKADVWHCQKDDHQSHEGIVKAEAGPVLGRQLASIYWHGQGGEVFAKELREVTAYRVADGLIIDFASKVSTTGGPIKLDGDPQHAGFQFRAHNDVAEKTAKETYYVRPDGKGKPGETRNWDPKSKKGPVNLPWNALSFVLDGKRYTVCYLDHPGNPHETRFSERDYARFGCYFEHEITPEKPLELKYRLFIKQGEMDVPDVASLSAAFQNPPAVTTK